MTQRQRLMKRSFDVVFSSFGLLAFGWLILICWAVASIDTRLNGFFTQERVGKGGRVFRIVKIRTMRSVDGVTSCVTKRDDSRITRLGSGLRKWKLDELPQLWNVLMGDMSFVGPRPDVEGFADQLAGEERALLTIRPGITGPATLAFRDEEDLLAECRHPERYNREVIFPAKVKMNLQYVKNYSFRRDLVYIVATIVPGLREKVAPAFETCAGA